MPSRWIIKAASHWPENRSAFTYTIALGKSLRQNSGLTRDVRNTTQVDAPSNYGLPNRSATGCGKLIRGHGAERRYGHVDVVVELLDAGAQSAVSWSAEPDAIPSEQHPVIMSAAEGSLAQISQRYDGHPVRVTITGGTWAGDCTNDLYDVATELAIGDALKKL